MTTVETKRLGSGTTLETKRLGSGHDNRSLEARDWREQWRVSGGGV